MADYCTLKDYAESVSSLEARITRYEEIREVMEANLPDFVLNTGVQSHKLNDGQVVIETQYRSVKDYTSAIRGIEHMINYLKQKITGGLSYSRPHSSFDKYPGI